MDAMEAIMTRRSVRKMKAEAPERALLEQVIEAGRSAPSGSNSQSTHLIVITEKETLSVLQEKVQAAFAKMEEGPDTYVSLRNSIRASKKGNYVFHYGAPVLIVTANKKGYGNAMADSACVLENMMIASHALGLGSCWINQLHWLTEDAEVRGFLETLGLGADEFVTGGLIVGHADGAPGPKFPKKNGNPVTWA